jgi:hypothetical protein
MLRDEIRFSMEVLKQIPLQKLDVPRVTGILTDWLVRYFFERWGIRLDAKDLHLLEIDLEVNAQGLSFAARNAINRGN